VIRYRKKTDVIFERFGSELLVFDLNTNVPYRLNGMASFVFTVMDGRRDSKAIAERVCQEYEVSLERALVDIQDLSRDLDQKGIIESVR